MTSAGQAVAFGHEGGAHLAHPGDDWSRMCPQISGGHPRLCLEGRRGIRVAWPPRAVVTRPGSECMKMAPRARRSSGRYEATRFARSELRDARQPLVVDRPPLHARSGTRAPRVTLARACVRGKTSEQVAITGILGGWDPAAGSSGSRWTRDHVAVLGWGQPRSSGASNDSG